MESKVDKLHSSNEEKLEESNIVEELGLPLNALSDLEEVDRQLKEDCNLEQRLISI